MICSALSPQDSTNHLTVLQEHKPKWGVTPCSSLVLSLCLSYQELSRKPRRGRVKWEGKHQPERGRAAFQGPPAKARPASAVAQGKLFLPRWMGSIRFSELAHCFRLKVAVAVLGLF